MTTRYKASQEQRENKGRTTTDRGKSTPFHSDEAGSVSTEARPVPAYSPGVRGATELADNITEGSGSGFVGKDVSVLFSFTTESDSAGELTGSAYIKASYSGGSVSGTTER